MGLSEYQRKRDFSRTAEPKAKQGRRSAKTRRGRFVVQKHDASRLHYDLRLEMEGVLKSWAVPKGVPFEKGEKHLAVQVEDHPVDYATFEGTIPKGQYGGGTVMLWDQGTFEGLGSDDPAKDITEGKLHFEMHGKKIDGEWTLIHIKRGEGNEWLLLKSGESVRAVSKKADNQSCETGRTMAQIARENSAQWQSNRPEKSEESDSKRSFKARVKAHAEQADETPAALKKLPKMEPRFVEPMKAKLAGSPPGGDAWVYELKFDGFRALAVKTRAGVELVSRNEKPLTKKFEELPPALETLAWSSGVMDGEIVALDAQGRSSFQLLQAYEMNEERPPICFYAFDLPNLDGRDLRALPLEQRKELLQAVIGDDGGLVRFSANIEGDAQALLGKIKQLGLEGIIGKQRASTYETGRRSGAWIKLKVTNEQEFVIGGYTAPQGSRKHFGALLVGYYVKANLHFAAKVGTGFSEKLLRELHGRFEPLRQNDCPFSNLPTQRQGRWGEGITRAEMKRCTWLEPRLVAQVRFTEWTRDGGLRHPGFLGLREDKDASEITREAAK